MVIIQYYDSVKALIDIRENVCGYQIEYNILQVIDAQNVVHQKAQLPIQYQSKQNSKPENIKVLQGVKCAKRCTPRAIFSDAVQRYAAVFTGISNILYAWITALNLSIY